MPPPSSGVQLVVYVIAAYTIPLCTLALYAVFLRHRERVFAADAEAEATEAACGPSGEPTAGFNIGAALLSPVWMWGHGMRVPGALLLVLFGVMVPLSAREMWTPLLFVATVPLAAGAALGFVGNRIAVRHRGAESRAAFSKSQLPWATVGVLIYAVVLPWVWYFVFAKTGL